MSYEQQIGQYLPGPITTITVSFLDFSDRICVGDYQWLVERIDDLDELECYRSACKAKQFHIAKLMAKLIMLSGADEPDRGELALYQIAIDTDFVKMVRYLYAGTNSIYNFPDYLDYENDFKPLIEAGQWDMIDLLIELHPKDSQHFLELAVSENSLGLTKRIVEKHNARELKNENIFEYEISNELYLYVLQNCETSDGVFVEMTNIVDWTTFEDDFLRKVMPIVRPRMKKIQENSQYC